MRTATGLQDAQKLTSLAWFALAVGLGALYLPTYFNLYRVFWVTRDGSYGAIMAAVTLWLLWRQRSAFRESGWPEHQGVGFVVLLLGLLFYIVGRSQSFYQLEVLSQIPVLFGLACLCLGARGVRRLAFPILLLVFVIPIPGSLADELLLPLKELVSRIVDDILHFAGYPIARNGVVLLIGPYSLLIADACSGLNSMIALSGIGLLYIYLSRTGSRWLELFLLASILPIALLANILRVLALVLITYYFGDEAGVSFHDKASYLEILVAFGGFFLLDLILSRLSSTVLHSLPVTPRGATPRP
jgi:exosortase B